jgi:16S rRNA U516 pseudouridylate synthase RsuA-like enzyme
MLAAVDIVCLDLRRVSYGPAVLGDLADGECRCATPDEEAWATALLCSPYIPPGLHRVPTVADD